MNITPVLLCGGSGTRLWPLSRKSYPKQFVRLMGEETLFKLPLLEPGRAIRISRNYSCSKFAVQPQHHR